MASITTKYVTENELNNEMSIEELTQYALGINIFLTDKLVSKHVLYTLPQPSLNHDQISEVLTTSCQYVGMLIIEPGIQKRLKSQN
ncbi:8673_t:CDS:2 [Cetraspora pellucida]|uniref:8673_t:CDS:1 n=1 Tax=Cetraspora pellucida TaxID=1433469 RepID=A0ACA9KR48_9GLOM|nr:8673_t:CDS:2 [Cetraspora pellucida]